MPARCPLYPRKQTSGGVIGMSALGQKQTSIGRVVMSAFGTKRTFCAAVEALLFDYLVSGRE
jgi:hypothetical protein